MTASKPSIHENCFNYTFEMIWWKINILLCTGMLVKWLRCVIQCDSRQSVFEDWNDRERGNNWFLCHPSSFFFSCCLPLDVCFILLQRYHIPVGLRLVLHDALCAHQMSGQGVHEQQMETMGSGSVLSSITKLMWWYYTQGTTKGKTDFSYFPSKSLV